MKFDLNGIRSTKDLIFGITFAWFKIHQRNFMMVLEPCTLGREREREKENYRE